jgi:hypothetical protein
MPDEGHAIGQSICEQVPVMIDLTPTQEPSTATSLEAALRTQLALYPKSHWYALVDSSQIPDFAKALRRGDLHKVEYVSLFDMLEPAPEERGAGGDAAPYLLSLDTGSTPDAALTYTMQKALNTFAVSWLVSPLNRDKLAQRLVQRTEAQLTENVEVLLRFYDSRILPNVLSVLTPEQAATFSNAAQGWWFADRKGQLQSCACRFAPEDPFQPPVAFSQTQEDKLTELAFPDAVLGQLQQTQSDLLAPMDRAQQHAFVTRQIAKVKELKLDSMVAILTYCVLALAEGEESLERLSPQDKIAAIKTGEVPLGETNT